MATKVTKKKAKNAVKKAAKKTETAVKKTGDYVSKNPKTTLYIVLGVGALILGYKVYKAINKKFGGDVDDEVGHVGGETSNATITDQQATNFAQQLLDAMNVNRNSVFAGGTDEDTIEQVFDRLQNGDDFIKVFNAFGKKDYNGYNSPVEGLEFIDAFEKRNLVYWLQSEISSFWDRTLYNKIKEIIDSTGVFVF